jgi:predicted nuclease with TOPRIM domain
MGIYEEIKGYLEEIKEENENFSKAENPEEEIEALKEMMDAFMRGMNRTREKIDQYNDRRWQR